MQMLCLCHPRRTFVRLPVSNPTNPSHSVPFPRDSFVLWLVLFCLRFLYFFLVSDKILTFRTPASAPLRTVGASARNLRIFRQTVGNFLSHRLSDGGEIFVRRFVQRWRNFCTTNCTTLPGIFVRRSKGCKPLIHKGLRAVEKVKLSDTASENCPTDCPTVGEILYNRLADPLYTEERYVRKTIIRV